VRWNNNWESKLSDKYWVVTHEENEMENMSNWNLRKLQCFKRTNPTGNDKVVFGGGEDATGKRKKKK
jgi:hypothetical protein